MKYKNKLNLLDFTPGIRAEYINENFDIIKKWIEEERIRNGGYGIVEGFELSKDIPSLSIHVDAGVIINEEGGKIEVGAHTFQTCLPVMTRMVEEVAADENALLKLKFSLYSPKEKHTILYNPPEHNVLHKDEVKILDLDNGRYVTKANIVMIDENIVVLSSSYANKKIRVEYFYANDRIDAIMLKKDGSEYIYETGIISPSPSQQVIEDYLKNGYYFIGFAYWHIGHELDVEFITSDRTLRPIYTSKDNKLYLNGQLYTGQQMIHFIEPTYPKGNDLWYSCEEEILYIWRPNKEGNFEWRPINDLSRYSREYNIFLPGENPKDLQTFLFDGKTNLRFVPGKNQLMIVIDQVVIMQDQFEEIYEESKYNKNAVTGRGFRLKAPLERPSIVEVFVSHNVANNRKKEDLFEHTSAFIDTDSIIVVKEVDEKHIWKCNGQYQIGNHQLDVWIDGRRLADKQTFIECTDDGKEAGLEDYGKLSSSFRIVNIPKIIPGTTISYKIIRQMSNYDNLRAVTDALNKRVSEAVASLESAEGNIQDIVDNVNSSLSSVHNKIAENAENIRILETSKISKKSGISVNNLSTDLAKHIFNKQLCLTYQAGQIQHEIPELMPQDFISLYWINDEQRMILIRDVDYKIKADINGKAIIELDPRWMAEDALIYIEAMKLGIE